MLERLKREHRRAHVARLAVPDELDLAFVLEQDEVSVLAEQLVGATEGAAMVWIQSPVRLDTPSEPQPDLAVLRRRADRYAGGHPMAPDVLLIVEVSDSTLRYDRDVKAELYAKHGIPELWVVDVPDRRLHVFRQPRDGRYADRFVAEADTVPISTLPKHVDLARLFAVSERSSPRDA